MELGEYKEWVTILFHTIKEGGVTQGIRRIAGEGTWLQGLLRATMFKGIGKAHGYHILSTREKVKR